MGRAEPGIEGVQGEEGAGNGVVRGDFRDFLRRIKPRCQESRHFSQWSGEIGRFLMIDENRDARPRCQSQRGLAESVVSSEEISDIHFTACAAGQLRWKSLRAIRLQPPTASSLRPDQTGWRPEVGAWRYDQATETARFKVSVPPAYYRSGRNWKPRTKRNFTSKPSPPPTSSPPPSSTSPTATEQT